MTGIRLDPCSPERLDRYAEYAGRKDTFQDMHMLRGQIVVDIASEMADFLLVGRGWSRRTDLNR